MSGDGSTISKSKSEGGSIATLATQLFNRGDIRAEIRVT